MKGSRVLLSFAAHTRTLQTSSVGVGLFGRETSSCKQQRAPLKLSSQDRTDVTGIRKDSARSSQNPVVEFKQSTLGMNRTRAN